eukprot:m.73518 g.73518  ORF g.73518 m.73518 type:complete len:78 (-) comp11773_c0_seq1:2602-2835(-)
MSSIYNRYDGKAPKNVDVNGIRFLFAAIRVVENIFEGTIPKEYEDDFASYRMAVTNADVDEIEREAKREAFNKVLED